jgi:RNA polymerase sigma factor (sigma-70 family)
MWERAERSPALPAPGSNNYSGLIASSTIKNDGSEAYNFQGLSDEDANDLCERYLPLAYKIAGKYQDRGIDLDVLHSAALAGLVEASRKYDPQRGPFGPYATPWIKGEITALFKKAKKHGRTESLDTLIIVNEETGSETNTKKVDLIVDESVPALIPNLDNLTPKERTIVESRNSGDSLCSVGERLGVSPERVRQIEAKATEKLRKQKGNIALACIRDLLNRRGYQKPFKARPLLKSIKYPGRSFSPSEQEALVSANPGVLQAKSDPATHEWWRDQNFRYAKQTVDPHSVSRCKRWGRI